MYNNISNITKKIKWPYVVSITSIITSFITQLLVLYLTHRVDKLNYALAEKDTASKYIEIFASENSSNIAKSLALSAMLKHELLDPVILLSAATKFDDIDSPGNMVEFLYEFGKKYPPSPYPIGHIRLPGQKNGDEYTLKG